MSRSRDAEGRARTRDPGRNAGLRKNLLLPAPSARSRPYFTEGVRAIVIDRTNPGREQRKTFVEMARAAGYRVKIVHFDIPEQVCEQRIRGRKNHPTLGTDRMAEAIAAYQRNFDPPSAEECDDLVIVPA